MKNIKIMKRLLFTLLYIPFFGIAQDELDFFKNWIGDRLLWIDNNLPGNCITPPPVSVNNFSNNSRLLKIVDALAREVSPSSNTPLFYIYEDGTVQKKLFIK